MYIIFFKAGSEQNMFFPKVRMDYFFPVSHVIRRLQCYQPHGYYVMLTICWASVTESGPALSQTSGICTTTKYWFTAGPFSPTRSCFATATTASSGLKNSHISFFQTKHLKILMFKHSFHFVLIPHICETQWRHSVKIKLYNTSSPILHSVKRSDVTRWKQGYIRSPPPYFIVLANSVKIKEVKVIEFHRITWIDRLIKQITHNYSCSYRLRS